ncbi:MAG: bifunctional 5,10-methylenetetrahydrofolate dehydrogenase/5,10-methenyltetrahydrofolate cyclohydrolase [Patescibacteria group bacterium]|jgi:methylenetetrahydrofolate dehydrogenase (NADP+)/methenyltetrahydrofolate cyclohydrolase
MVKVISGKKIAEKVKDKIAQEIFAFKKRPNLAIILVGSREDSKLYVSLKEREGKKVGVDTHLYLLEEKQSEKELIEIIKFLNEDPLIDGILVQLPLPTKFNTDKVILSINPEKDVDGFHPQKPDYIKSPVMLAIIACLDEIKMKGENNTACIFRNSEVFEKEIKKELGARGFSFCKNSEAKKADLVITALGKPQSLKKEIIKPGAVIIDIGITKTENGVFGDVDFKDVEEKASFITPVPGGIGPMTIAFLFKNVWEIFKRKTN